MSSLSINGKVVSSDIEAVIFDKDGTLIDVHHYWSTMIRMRSTMIVKKWPPLVDANKVQDRLIDAMGIDLNLGKVKSDGPVGIKPRAFIVDVAIQVMDSININIASHEMENIFLKVDQKTSKNILPLLKLLPHVRQLLKELNQCGVSIMLATTDITSRAYIAMKALKIDHFFSAIVGGDAVELTKPSPDLALKVIDKCNIDRRKTIVIGDHPVDVQMGVSAKTGYNVGVLTGLSSVSAFDSLDCFVINDLKGIQISC